jgi:hypothetical protein
MDALVENASEPRMPLKEQDPLQAGAGCTHGNSHSCGSASNDDDIVMVIVQHIRSNWNGGIMEYWKNGIQKSEDRRQERNTKKRRE